jgi:putative phosphoesterase
MRIGIVSDTHGHVANTLAGINILESLDVERVLHCGDIGTPEIPPFFKRWPTDFVFGNCDIYRDDLTAAIRAAGLTSHGAFGDLKIGERRIAILHSDDHRKFHEVIDSGEYDLVCYGHTHVAKIEEHGRTIVLNPGALYRANPHSLAIVDLDTMHTEVVNL